VGGGFFPLSEVHRGLIGTAWTVFTGSQPEPMEVEILGVLRGARGPGHDMILAQLHGAKPEYTGVVAGMSGSPVYIGNRLLGSLSYRIGQFSKDPIAGITPIEQMLEVRDLPIQGQGSGVRDQGIRLSPAAGGEYHAGDGDAAGDGRLPLRRRSGCGSRRWPERGWRRWLPEGWAEAPHRPAEAGGAADTRLGQGDCRHCSRLGGERATGARRLEIAATCTVTYVDRKQLLACGHALLQAGPVSLPMTTTEVVATLASPLNAFKIVNTGATIGAFNEDRDAAIRGVFGARAQMIPVHIRVHGAGEASARNARSMWRFWTCPR
jgi:hypothetical protein